MKLVIMILMAFSVNAFAEEAAHLDRIPNPKVKGKRSDAQYVKDVCACTNAGVKAFQAMTEGGGLIAKGMHDAAYDYGQIIYKDSDNHPNVHNIDKSPACQAWETRPYQAWFGMCATAKDKYKVEE